MMNRAHKAVLKSKTDPIALVPMEHALNFWASYEEVT